MAASVESALVASVESALAKVIDLEVWARVHLPKLIEENRGDHDRLLNRFKDINKMLVKDLREVHELLDPVKLATSITVADIIKVAESIPEHSTYLAGPNLEQEYEPLPTMRVNGVEMVSVGCESLARTEDEADEAAARAALAEPGERVPYSEYRRQRLKEGTPDASHDLPETEGTPVWIWENEIQGQESFEDFRGAMFCRELRVPIGWSLVSTRQGTKLRNAFKEEVSAFAALEWVRRGIGGFRMIATTEP